MFYRVRQFWRALFPIMRSPERAYLERQIPPDALPLFFRQSAAEQRHALDVAQELQSWALSVSENERRALILAALFHDCGKSLMPIKLWQRVAIVLLEHLPASLRPKAEQIEMIRVTLQIAAEHAHWGSELAKEAGLPADVCALIREHHQPKSHLGHLLQKADNLH